LTEIVNCQLPIADYVLLNIILLGLTSLLTDFSSEMVVPILPFFIKTLGGGGIAIGLIFGFGDAVAAILKVVSGHWADKTRRYKLFVFIGYLFSAVAKFFYPLAKSWQNIGIIRPIERVGKGFRDAPRDAIVSESLKEGQRGRGFGVQRAMDSVGAILGSVVVLVLFVYLGKDFTYIFWLSAFIGLIAVIPIFFVRVPANLKLNHRRVSLKALPWPAKKFIIIATIFALANFSVAFFILSAQSSFTGLGQTEALALTLLLYIFFNIFDASFSEPAGALSDRVGRRKVIFSGYLLFSVVSIGFLFSHTLQVSNTARFLILLGLFALYGIFKALIDASQRAYISDLSPTDIRGTALGTFETLTGLAAIPSGLIAGIFWNINILYTFAFGAGMSLVASVLLLRLRSPFTVPLGKD